MKKRITVSLAVVLLAFFALSCQRKSEVKGVELQVKFSVEPLSDNLFADMTYEWNTGADFQKMEKDFNIFVHFWHKDNMLFQDDHLPEVPTSQWGPGRAYSYVRRVYIPTFIDEFDPQFTGAEQLKLSIGFYSPLDRTGKSKFESLKETLKVLPPPPGTPEIIYESGWYDLEINPEAFLKQWRWTSREARCIIDNPHRDAMLVIRGGVNKNIFVSQKVILRINDGVFAEFIPAEDFFEKFYNVKKELLGDKDEFYLVVATDQTFIPARIDPNSKDERELGLQVSFLYFR